MGNTVHIRNIGHVSEENTNANLNSKYLNSSPPPSSSQPPQKKRPACWTQYLKTSKLEESEIVSGEVDSDSENEIPSIKQDTNSTILPILPTPLTQTLRLSTLPILH